MESAVLLFVALLLFGRSGRGLLGLADVRRELDGEGPEGARRCPRCRQWVVPFAVITLEAVCPRCGARMSNPHDH